MKTTFPTRFIVAPAVIAVLIGSAGCGSGLIKPTIRVLENGAPVKLEAGQSLTVDMVPDGAAESETPVVHVGSQKEEGVFLFEGRTKKGIPKGKYRVMVLIIAGVDRRAKKIEDRLQGKFSGGKSQIIREFKDSGEITIDIGKDSG